MILVINAQRWKTYLWHRQATHHHHHHKPFCKYAYHTVGLWSSNGGRLCANHLITDRQRIITKPGVCARIDGSSNNPTPSTIHTRGLPNGWRSGAPSPLAPSQINIAAVGWKIPPLGNEPNKTLCARDPTDLMRVSSESEGFGSGTN